MKFLFSILFTLTSFNSFAITPDFMWVEILNKDIKSGNNEFGINHIYQSPNGFPYKSNTCNIGSIDGSFKSEVKVIGQLSDQDYIFEYSREGAAYGSACPSGVFFKAPLKKVINK